MDGEPVGDGTGRKPVRKDSSKAGTLLLILTGAVVLFGIAVLAGLAYASHRYQWEGFWKGAGQPYATAIVALAAFTAAAIAFHNSRSQLSELQAQRAQDQSRWEQQRDQDQAQREVDQSRWEDQRNREAAKDLRARFSEIITQLANGNATVRRSGAYAMAALASDWRNLGEEQETKVCLGVLASYLTSPNRGYTDEPSPNAGEDGPVRALIVALLSSNAGDDGLVDLWGSSKLLAGADLRGVAFTTPVNRVDFTDADLRGASFSSSDLKGVEFWSADLSNVDLSFKDLSGAGLTFAKLHRADLTYTNLTAARAPFAEFQDANLSYAKLYDADLDGANFCGADLCGTDLGDVNLIGADYDDETKWPDGYTPPPLRVPPE